jgi:hypothetical protein
MWHPGHLVLILAIKFSIARLLGAFEYGQNTKNMGIGTSYRPSQPQYNDLSTKAAAFLVLQI